jgi:hypothetical protein
MLKISILTAWAELQVRSASQEYLVAVIQPYRWLLAPFWIGSLRDFAQLRTDPEASMGSSSLGMGESGLGRDVLLPVSMTAYDCVEVALLMHSVLRESITASFTRGRFLSGSVRPFHHWRHGRANIHQLSDPNVSTLYPVRAVPKLLCGVRSSV